MDFNPLQPSIKVVTTTYEDSESSYQMTLKTDPLLPEKQKLVTRIYNTFTEHNKPIPTTSDFYRLGRPIGKGAFGKVVLAQHVLTT